MSSIEVEEGALEGKRRRKTKKFGECLTAPLQNQEPTSEKQTRTPCNGGLSHQTEGSSRSIAGLQPKKAFRSRLQTSSSKAKCSPYPMPEAKFQSKVMKMLVEIREEISAMKKQFGDAERHKDYTFPAQASTVDALYLLEKSLDSLKERQELINGLSKIGGIHLKDNVKRIMEKLMTNEVMSKFNMSGGKGKLAFRKLRLFTVVTESIQKTSSETESKIATAVAFCLKYAPDRVGGGGRKKASEDDI